MKIRLDFITNSSSSSFVVAKHLLTDEHLDKIRNMNQFLHDAYFAQGSEVWNNPILDWDKVWCGDHYNIHEDENYIEGLTSMDNGDFSRFIKEMGIDPKLIKIDDGGYR